MSDNERIAVLETEMKAAKITLETMVSDVKSLQVRWGMIYGIVGLVTNLPALISLLRGHP